MRISKALSATNWVRPSLLAALPLLAAACSQATPPLAAAPPIAGYSYLIGAGDQLQLVVWKSPELSATIVVRPDGKISIPLVEDIQAAGRTPTELAHALQNRLAEYVKNPIVSVMPVLFVGMIDRQIRVIGQAVKPRAFPYREDISVLDVVIGVGGLTQFAAGNRAVIVRTVDGKRASFGVRLDDLVRDGDVSANVAMAPGDVLIIPESWL